MTASSGTESIGIFYEILLVYCFQYPNQSRLDKFVFKTRYPQGALFGAARLRYVFAPDRLRYVRHPVQPLYQIRQVGVQVFGIHLLGHFVDAGGCILPQPLKAFP